MTSTPPATFSVDTTALRQTIDTAIERSWSVEDPARHLELLGSSLKSVNRSVIEIGETAAVAIEEQNNSNTLAYILVYDWLEKAKAFLLLWRDILLEEEKALLLWKEDLLPESSFATLKYKAKNELEKAAHYLLHELEEAEKNPNTYQRSVKRWLLETSPWLLYREQLQTIVKQSHSIRRQGDKLFETSRCYADIRKLFTTTIGAYSDYLGQLTDDIETELKKFSDQEEDGSVTALVKQVKGFLLREPEPNTVAEFIERLESMTGKLPGGNKWIVDNEDGLLLQRELNLERLTRTWLEAELMSLIQGIYSSRHQIRNRLQIVIRTSENRIDFDRQEEQSLAKIEIPRAFEQLTKYLRQSEEKMQGQHHEIEQRLGEELMISNVFREDFLALPIHQSLQQYRKYQQTGLGQIRDWLVEKGRMVKELGRSSLQKENLGVSEQIVRLVRNRKPQEDNSHYTNMFITEGYIGESFRVGREEELARAERIVEDWHSGYRGAILVTGNRLSGKSFFGELVGHKFFSNHLIALMPNARIELAGRFFETGYDLKKSLEFIVKNSRDERPMVWIDDLENWADENTDLAQNVKSLLHEIDFHARQLFFVVATGKSMKAQLQRHFEIDRYFQATLTMDRMSTAEITEAILIRHNATQLQLIDEENEKVNGAQIEQLVKPIYRISRGRVGDALRHWAYDISVRDEDSVQVIGKPYYIFPDHLSLDGAVLLRTILIERSVSEYNLRKIFGPAFRSQFQPLIQRFLNLGILTRRANGLLEINLAIISDLERLLEREKMIFSDVFIASPTV